MMIFEKVMAVCVSRGHYHRLILLKENLWAIAHTVIVKSIFETSARFTLITAHSSMIVTNTKKTW